MKMRFIVPTFAVAAFLLAQVGNAQPEPRRAVEILFPPVELQEVGKDKDKIQPPDKKKTPDKKDPAAAPETDLFTRTPTMGTQFPTGFNPNMLGDFGVFFAKQTITVTGTTTTTTTKTVIVRDSEGGKVTKSQTTTTTTTPTTETRTLLIPYASSAAAFKIAENESPRPVDRVFFTWNYFGAIVSPAVASPTNTTTAAQATSTINGISTNVATAVVTSIPVPPRARANLHRQMFGFEKTFLDGYASVELRAPFVQMTGNTEGIGAQNIGDLTIIGKYAFILDNTTGNVLSAGLALTVPTGPGIDVFDGTLHSTLFQPWFGYIVNGDGFFLNAFHSIVVPTDLRDVTLLFNDVGLNYWLYRGNPNGTLNYIIPTFEAHLTTPLNHRSADAVIFVPDMLVLTTGVHFGLMRNANLAVGVATPVTGPRVFNIETFVQLNWRF